MITNRTRFVGPALAALALLGARPASAEPLAATPPMGWNSWNWHGKQAINETIVKETMDALVATGLRDAGYVYVVVDGGWRDNHLGPNGELLAHPTKFPHGMKDLADYAHARGLKFGLHTVPGSHDCGGDPVGGYGHEEVQVRQFAAWGLDFVKLDKCRLQTGWDEAKVKAVYTKWSHLLAGCGRPMLFSISAYSFRPWYPEVCQMARTTPDIWARVAGHAVFDEASASDQMQPGAVNPPAGLTARKAPALLSVMAIADVNNQAATAAGHGYWNDCDMMVTGDQGLTVDEQKTHFALWCVMSSPLMLGDDPRHLDEAEKRLILNRECIAVDQDPTEQGRRVRTQGNAEIWVKHLRGDRRAVLLLNRDARAGQRVTLRAEDLQLEGAFVARDLFAHEDLGRFETLTRSLEPHASCFLLVTPATSGAAAPRRSPTSN